MLPILLSLTALPLVAQGFVGPSSENNAIIEQPGLVRFPLTVNEGPSKSLLRKRQGQSDLTPQKHGFFYSIQIQMGTPPQPVGVNFDTGSDELWVNPVCSRSTDPAFCQSFGRFNGSQTFVDLKRNGSIQYGTGFADLEYGYDFVQIGSARVSQQIFGVATDSSFASSGILGVGPSLDGWNSSYPLVMDSMSNQGFINSRAFSLDIRSIESQRGSVIFGGLDTKKYSGQLEKRPIIPSTASPDGYTRYWIYMDGLGVTTGNGSSVTIMDKVNGQGMLLDSGYTVSALPKALFNKLKDAFPQVTKPPQGSDLWRVPCSVGDSKGHVDFKFGKTVINVPFRDFIWKQPEDGSCVLGAIPDDSFPVLGDTFLRAAYVVYDWDNRNIHLANNEDCGSKLVPIGKGPDAVPSIMGECSADTTPTPSYMPLPTSSPVLTQTSMSSHGSNMTITRKVTRTMTSKVVSTAASNSQSIAISKAAEKSTSRVLPSDSAAFSTQTADPVAIDTTEAPVSTATFTVTHMYTITSCPPYVTNCPVGSVTSKTSVGTTTWYAPLSRSSDKAHSSSTALGVSESSSETVGSSSSVVAASHSSSEAVGSSSSVVAASHSSNEASSHSTKLAISLSIIGSLPSSSNLAASLSTRVVKPFGTNMTEAPSSQVTSPPETVITPALPNMVTSIFVTTKTHTVTHCSAKTLCTKGQVVTQVITSTTYLCPESTATFAIPRTHTCTVGEDGCKPGQKVTTTHTVTVVPVTTNAAPTPVPGCKECHMPPPVANSPITVISPRPQHTSSVLPSVETPVETVPYTAVPSMINSTTTVPAKTKQDTSSCATCVLETPGPSVVTAGAVSWRVPGFTTLIVVVAALMAW
ncbi:hypothetical protein CDD82_2274 [Ophiocordyceps australis]|uniref:Peptidase A1 domain-containing protein n=1 Tax=Ophiocordyceps australis TaxID=1399860 RepID=A0A2C5ZV22_9HYPO|nr:hypothetical protein CDD82_2274 [Ophiocordyceps australis]